MGKKKHKDRHGDRHDRKHGDKHGAVGQGAGHDGKHGGGAARSGSFPLPLAGIAAMVTQQLQSPAARAAMASGLRAAADALSKSSAGRDRPDPAAAPASAPPPPPPPPPPLPPPGDPVPPPRAARSPGQPDVGHGPGPDLGIVLGKAAEQVLGAFLRKKPGA